jgi:hypothetical protein
MSDIKNEGPQPPIIAPATAAASRKKSTGFAGGAIPGEHTGRMEFHAPPPPEDPDLALIREYKAASTQEKIRRWPVNSEARRQLNAALSRRGGAK